jgi:septum formation topological specificity factor MinE
MNNVNKELQTVVQKYTQNIVNNVMNKELQTVVQKYTQNIVNNVNEDAFE